MFQFEGYVLSSYFEFLQNSAVIMFQGFAVPSNQIDVFDLQFDQYGRRVLENGKHSWSALKRIAVSSFSFSDVSNL